MVRLKGGRRQLRHGRPKFQFLMVRLKVRPSSFLILILLLFQFLMVRLKEGEQIPVNKYFPFQFLMVRLKEQSDI